MTKKRISLLIIVSVFYLVLDKYKFKYTHRISKQFTDDAIKPLLVYNRLSHSGGRSLCHLISSKAHIDQSEMTFLSSPAQGSLMVVIHLFKPYC